MSQIRRFLIVGLGNPGAEYQNTYHSAGNFVLESLQRLIPSVQPAFTSEKLGKKSVLTSHGPKYTLLQSPSVMNVTGSWLVRAYREFLETHELQPSDVSIIVVHDDLEEDLGVVKIREWKRSHRGHNGVKSVLKSLTPTSESRWARISVGIGRPTARDHVTVSDYVLSKISRQSLGILNEQASYGLLQALLNLEKSWDTVNPLFPDNKPKPKTSPKSKASPKPETSQTQQL